MARMKMGKVPSQMTKKELTAFLLEQMLQLSKAERLLQEIREDAPHFGMPTNRIDGYFGTADSASGGE